MTYRHLKIDSRNRDSGTATDFRVKLPRSLHKGQCFELVCAHIPQTFHNIDSTNNSFSFVEGSTTQTATLTPGYYTNETIATELQTQMNAVGSYTYTVTLLENTQTLRIYSNGALQVIGSDSPLGFTTTTGFSTTNFGNEPVNLEKNQSLLIDLNNIVEIEGINYGCTFAVPSDVDVLQVLDWRPGEGYRQHVHITHDTKVLHLRLKDINNKTLDLHGSNWFIILKHIA